MSCFSENVYFFLRTETYKRETIASGARSWRTTSASTKPAKSDFFDEIEDFHKAGSDNEATLSSDEENMVPNKKQPFWKETLRQVKFFLNILIHIL